MPLLDIATAQPSFGKHLYSVRFLTVYHGAFTRGNEDIGWGSCWSYFGIPGKARNPNVGIVDTFRGGGLMIKAVATLEPRCSIRGNDDVRLGVDSSSLPGADNQSSSEDSTNVDDREKLRRMRISKANKGNTPWNKGRKHSPETLQRIKERTRLAMQDPKVKMKLVNLGHAQRLIKTCDFMDNSCESKETRIKIGVGVRIGWERRREKLMIQETCHFEWQNLIAEASRKGFPGEKELCWDSYKIQDKQLEQEWLESVEQRKKMPRPKGSKRAPKSAEQRRKISEAIAAKWADPTYRDRVYSGLSKYHGTPIGIEKPRRKAASDRQPRKTCPTKKTTNASDSPAGNVSENQSQRPKLKRRNAPLYKDPLASSKLEMIKNKSEAITRAKLLIAEAEKAADALEIAATKSPLAQASLIETRKLIAEAIKSIESIETAHVNSHEDEKYPSVSSSELINHVEYETDTELEVLNEMDHRQVNGIRGFALSDEDTVDFGFDKLSLEDLLERKDEDLPPANGSVNGKEQFCLSASSELNLSPLLLDHTITDSSFKEQLGKLETNGSNLRAGMLPDHQVKSESEKQQNRPGKTTKTKRWVCGKLVEVAEED